MLSCILAVFLILVNCASAQTFSTVSNCYQSIHTLNEDKALMETIEIMKLEIEKNPELKRTILDNPSQLESIKQSVSRCAEELLKKSQFKVLEYFIDSVLQQLEIDLSDEIKLIGNQVKKQIDTVVNYASSKKQIQTITPVFSWAQSQGNIFIQVKFAHRHDAPGCLEVRTEKVECTSDGFYFSAFGIQAHNPIRFVLNITFAKPINPELCSFATESVGRMFVNITKAEPEIWLHLLNGGVKMPQMRIWWDMKQQYPKDMEEFTKLLEEEEEKKQEEIWKKKKSKKQVEAANADKKNASEPVLSQDAPIEQAKDINNEEEVLQTNTQEVQE